MPLIAYVEINNDKQFKENTEQAILEKLNYTHVIEGFDMSYKLRKPKIKERCIQILALSKFRDLLNQSQERNKMNEDSFLKLMQLYNEMKIKSPSEFLQMDEIKDIIIIIVNKNLKI